MDTRDTRVSRKTTAAGTGSCKPPKARRAARAPCIRRSALRRATKPSGTCTCSTPVPPTRTAASCCRKRRSTAWSGSPRTAAPTAWASKLLRCSGRRRTTAAATGHGTPRAAPPAAPTACARPSRRCARSATFPIRPDRAARRRPQLRRPVRPPARLPSRCYNRRAPSCAARPAAPLPARSRRTASGSPFQGSRFHDQTSIDHRRDRHRRPQSR